MYSEPLARRHYAPVWGSAWGFRAAVLALAVLLSAVLSYSSGGFWLMRKQHYTQPDVRFEHDAILVLEGAAAGEERAWTSFAVAQKDLASRALSVDIGATEQDLNSDGTVDIIDVVAVGRGMSAVHGVKLLLSFRYKLAGRVDLEMTSLAYVQHSSALAGSALHVDGDLELRQRVSLADESTRVTYNTTLLDLGRLAGERRSASELQLPVILNNYLFRNETTVLKYDHPVWVPGTSASEDGFTVSARIRIPPSQEVLVRPSPLEAAKFAWVQFLAVFVVFYVFLSWVEWVAFHFRVVATRVVSDLQPKQHRF